ncbi:flippase [Natronomonas halophila]|uniref:flippase n=1 Tax=Natronomonas halophila TaxID=2747817 RepID=UPI0015B49E03|nr:flippase [Natronomonas halophila]QLD86823.1 flippase [Natronomonas halophila]
MSDDRNQAIRDIFKGAGVVYVGLVLELFISFLAQLLAARYLNTADFGSITAGVALLNLGAILGTMGLDEGLIRHLPRQSVVNRASLTRTAFLIAVPVSLTLGVLVAANASFIASNVLGDPTVTTSVRIFGATIPFASVLMLSIGGIRGQEVSRYRVYIENLLRPTLRFGLVVAAVIFGLGQAGFALAYAVPYAIGAAVAVVLLLRTFDVDIDAGSLSSDTTEFVRYSLPMTASRAANFVYRSSDIFLLLFFLNAGAVGTYGVAYAAGQLVGMFSAAFNFLGAPIASKIESSSGVDDMVTAHQPALRWLVILSFPAMAPLILFPESFIVSIYRPRYASGAGALVVLALTFAIDNVFNALGNLLRGLGKARPLALNSIITGLTNIGLNVVLIPRYGILGAALATFASYLLLDFLMMVELWYFTGDFPLSYSVVSPALIGVPLVGLAWVGRGLVPPSLPGLVAFGAVFATIYIVSIIVILGLEPEEVMLIRSAQARFGLRLGPLEWILDRFS